MQLAIKSLAYLASHNHIGFLRLHFRLVIDRPNELFEMKQFEKLEIRLSNTVDQYGTINLSISDWDSEADNHKTWAQVDCFWHTYKAEKDIAEGKLTIVICLKEKVEGYTHIYLYLEPLGFANNLIGTAIVGFFDYSEKNTQ
jgi:hypothetical protein